MTDSERTRPDRGTREEEARDARVTAGADRQPTPDEEQIADAQELDPEVAEHYQEMIERGADQQGEGRI
jgi:hypothetical protein